MWLTGTQNRMTLQSYKYRQDLDTPLAGDIHRGQK